MIIAAASLVSSIAWGQGAPQTYSKRGDTQLNIRHGMLYTTYFLNPVHAGEVIEFVPGPGTKDTAESAVKSLGGPLENEIEGKGYFAHATTLGSYGRLILRLASMACTDKGPGVDLVVKDASVPEPMKISVALDQSSPWIELGTFEKNSVEIDLDKFGIKQFSVVRIDGREKGTGDIHHAPDIDYVEGRPCKQAS